MHEHRGQFKGVVPAIITPYTAEGTINEAAFREVMEYNIRAGVHGFWVAGGSGEGVLLTDDERIRLAEVSADQAKGRAKIILHVGSLTTGSCVKIAEGAAKAGADAIACVPPFFYPPSDATIVQHYKTVAAATGLPLFLYNWPRTTGVEIMPPLMETLVEEVPELAGLKHSVPNLYNLRTFAQMGLTAFVGGCGMLLPAMALGAVGTIDGPPTVFPEVFMEVYQAYVDGDLARAQQSQERGNHLRDLLGGPAAAYHAAFKAVLSEKLGIDCGSPRAPIPSLTDDARASVFAALKGAGAM
jgi:dihydrodipicolinate synthase/N-acetylneuraminate lyase